MKKSISPIGETWPFSPHGENHLIKRENYSFHHQVKKLTSSPHGENKLIKSESKTFHLSLNKLTFSPPGELGNIVKNTLCMWSEDNWPLSTITPNK